MGNAGRVLALRLTLALLALTAARKNAQRGLALVWRCEFLLLVIITGLNRSKKEAMLTVA